MSTKTILIVVGIAGLAAVAFYFVNLKLKDSAKEVVATPALGQNIGKGAIDEAFAQVKVLLSKN